MIAKSPRSDFWFLLVALLLGAAVRLLFLVATDFSIDSDEAIVGLMAKHLLEGGRWSIFYYGQPYMGSLEPTLTALIFAVAGVSSAALKLVPTIFSLLLILGVYALGRAVGGQLTGRVAALYLAVPPPALLEWSTKARGGFIELVFLGTLVFLSSVYILRAPKRVRAKDLSVLGVLSGLAWWTNNQAIFYLVPAAIALAMILPRKIGWVPSFRMALFGLIGFVVGSAPFWWFNLLAEPRFQTFTMLGQKASLSDAFSHFGKVFTESLPILVGSRRFWSVDEIFPGSAVLASILWLIAVAVLVLVRFQPRWSGRLHAPATSMDSERAEAGLTLLLIFLVTTPIIFSLSAFGWLTSAPRYLLPLYTALPILVGLLASVLVCSFRGFGYASVVVAFIGWNFLSNYGTGAMTLPGEPFVFGRERVSRDHREVLRVLDALGVTHVRTNYWIGYRLAFESGEKILFSVFGEPNQVRIPDYERGDTSFPGPYPYLLSRSQAALMGSELARTGYEYKVRPVGDYVLLDSIEPIVDNLAPLRIRHEQISVTSRSEWARFLVDGEYGTRWGSGTPQHPGMSLLIRLDAPEAIAGLALRAGFWPQDASRALTIQLRNTDKQPEAEWCTVFEAGPGERSVAAREDFVLYFEPLQANEIRIIQNGHHPVFDWSIAELEVYTKASPDAQ